MKLKALALFALISAGCSQVVHKHYESDYVQMDTGYFNLHIHYDSTANGAPGPSQDFEYGGNIYQTGPAVFFLVWAGEADSTGTKLALHYENDAYISYGIWEEVDVTGHINPDGSGAATETDTVQPSGDTYVFNYTFSDPQKVTH